MHGHDQQCVRLHPLRVGVLQLKTSRWIARVLGPSLSACLAVVGGCADQPGQTSAKLSTLPRSSDPPTVLTLPGESRKELGHRIYGECLSDLGLSVHDDGTGGFYIDDPSGRLFTDAVRTECEKRLKAVGLGNRPPTTSELKGFFAVIVTWAKCVQSLGYDLPITGSEAEFIASMGEVGPIDPAPLLSSLAEAKLTALYDHCPQY